MRSLNTNLLGPVNLTRAVLPYFRSKNSGFLVFVGSQAGWKGDPGASAYCAGKFAQEGKGENQPPTLYLFVYKVEG